MTRVFLDHIAYALGSVREDVERAVADERTLSPAPTLRSAGFAFHHRCAEDESSLDLAIRAVGAVRDRLGKIDAILYSTCLPQNANAGDPRRFDETRDIKHLMDFPASRLQAHFRLDDAIVVGISQQACTGMLGSLRLARAMIVAEPAMSRILCLTSDRFPPGALYEQAYNLISDGAAACVVSRDEGAFEYVGGHQITNGALAAASDDETVGSFFNYTHRAIQETLARSGITSKDLAWVATQNTNRKAWQILSRLLGIPAERVAMRTIGEAAHMISGDNLVNLRALEEEGALRPGDLVLLPMAGYGMNWQCTLLRRLGGA
ncbi:MAG: 3-oxoacyl-[acyl-carrier-protein] synthase III C-terminal domain-containing protein [Planctomycetota bacterium]